VLPHEILPEIFHWAPGYQVVRKSMWLEKPSPAKAQKKQLLILSMSFDLPVEAPTRALSYLDGPFADEKSRIHLLCLICT